MTKDESKGALIDEFVERTTRAVQQGDLRALREVITDALKAKVHHGLAKLPEFQEQLALLTARISDRDDEHVVLALAELGRLHSSVRSKFEWVPALATQLLSIRTPASFQHGDGDQRHHAAIAVVASGVPVDPYVMSKAVVEEEKGEKARRVWAKALLKGVSLSEALEGITKAITEIHGMSGENRSLRLQRILKALNEQFSEIDIQIDENLCDHFKNFIAKGFINAPRPIEYRASIPAVEELIKVTIQLIRLKFRLGTEPNLYRAVALSERWLPTGGWTRLTHSSIYLRQLRRTLLEGILLLLEQGKPDDELIAAHRVLSLNAKLAQKELRESETSARNLSPEQRAWLASGGTKKLAVNTVELDDTDDLSIAMMMVVADNLRHRADAAVDAALNDIRFKAPTPVDTITELANLTKQLIDRVNILAERRQLQLFGSPGEVVEFSRYAYRLPEDRPVTRHVQIQSPGVEKRGRMASRVVVQALVDAHHTQTTR